MSDPTAQSYSPGLAYLDSFAGLVPCRVVRVHDNGAVDIKLTATRGAYKRGETITANTNWVVPRDRVRHSRGQQRIFGAWVWTD